MKNKGFVLMETIVVIVVVTVALLTIFTSYNKILSKVKTENKYDTSEYIYMTSYIRDYIKSQVSTSANSFNCVSIVSQDTCVNNINSSIINYNSNRTTFDIYGVEKIYIVTNLNTLENNKEKFDAYMIDYIRKLDVRDSDELIIVEYKREAKKEGTYDTLTEYNNTFKLYETYIASLEW